MKNRIDDRKDRAEDISTPRRNILSRRLSLLPCLALVGSLLLTLAGVVTMPMAAAADGSGPVRMARFTYLSGSVTWRDSTQSEWSTAVRNLPLRQGAQILTSDGSNVEIRFDDGSWLRLDSNTLITLQTLYSDSQGEFTEITFNNGQGFLRLKNNKYSVYQLNTSLASLKVTNTARIRVGCSNGAQFAVRQGQAVVEGTGGKVTLHSGEYLNLASSSSSYAVERMPAPDAWDSWNNSRDQQIDISIRSTQYLPPNIALATDDLNTYGTWRSDSSYGHVWCPRQTSDWRPYGAGNWTWVDPVGWTWVSDDPWGWAPYHYGTWVHASYGWGWCPGPAYQYWSPAVVSFSIDGGNVGWCPLDPREVRYPGSLSIGFGGGNWSLFFSIGSCAAYYPYAGGYCVARPWDNGYINRVTYINNTTNIYNINHNTYFNGRFNPRNARFGGATLVSAQGFGGRGSFRAAGIAGGTALFAHGRLVGAPGRGIRPVVGPQNVRVTREAFTPTRSFRPADPRVQQLARRTVFRAPLPNRVPRSASAPQPGQSFTSHIVARRPQQVAGIKPNIGRPTPTNPSADRPGSFGGKREVRPVTPKNPNGRPGGLNEYLKDRATGKYPTRNGKNSSAGPGASKRTGSFGNSGHSTAQPEHNRANSGSSEGSHTSHRTSSGTHSPAGSTSHRSSGNSGSGQPAHRRTASSGESGSSHRASPVHHRAPARPASHSTSQPSHNRGDDSSSGDRERRPNPGNRMPERPAAPSRPENRGPAPRERGSEPRDREHHGR